MKKAIIIVDIQNDFMPDGALPVPEGYKIIPLINKLMPMFDLVIATKDWHPVNHGSFAGNHADVNPGEVIKLDGLEQVLWPEHCVQNTEGAKFVKELNVAGIDAVFEKGTDPMVDSYSGFFDNAHRKATGLENYLKECGVRQVFIAGVATEYCVKFTALDAVALGFETFLIRDVCRGVNIHPKDTENAISEMKINKIETTTTPKLLKGL